MDEPTAEFSEKINQFQNEQIKFFINNERKGKANVLNEAAKLASGKVLLFLDSDVQVTSDPDFLKKIIMEMQMTDVLDIKKEVSKGKSFLSQNGLLRVLHIQRQRLAILKIHEQMPLRKRRSVRD